MPFLRQAAKQSASLYRAFSTSLPSGCKKLSCLQIIEPSGARGVDIYKCPKFSDLDADWTDKVCPKCGDDGISTSLDSEEKVTVTFSGCVSLIV